MKREFVPYEIALALKELGFDEECLMYWNDYGKQAISRFQLLNRIDSWCINYIEAPLFSQAFRFFKEKCGFNISITNDGYIILDMKKSQSYIDEADSYEEAELECLVKLIEIVKTKTK